MAWIWTAIAMLVLVMTAICGHLGFALCQRP